MRPAQPPLPPDPPDPPAPGEPPEPSDFPDLPDFSALPDLPPDAGPDSHEFGELAEAAAVAPGPLTPPAEIDAATFQAGCGESLQQALDVRSWENPLDLAAGVDRLEREIGDGIDQENDLQREVRRRLFPLVAQQHGVPGAGVYRATPRQVRRVQASTLLNGGVEACHATHAAHDTLPVTVTQIGASLVSYLGEAGSWGHRVFRRDLRIRSGDPLQEAFDVLSRRATRAFPEEPSRRDQLSELIRRGATAYAERAVLADVSRAAWRLGHGQPMPYELLTGSGSTDLLRMSLDLMRRLVLDHRRFVFVPSRSANRTLLTLGGALRPLEFFILETTWRHAYDIVEHGHLRGEHRRAAEDFVQEVSPKIVAGMYRTYPHAPPQAFYAHADHAPQAALIAMADSLLQPHRGFPTLIDLARSVTHQLFGAEAFEASVQGAYTRHGDPLRFLGERATRG